MALRTFINYIVLCFTALAFVAKAQAEPSFQPEDYTPVAADKSETYQFQILSSSSYSDGQGRQVIDVIEGSQSYFALSVENADGKPVIGVDPEFKVSGSSVMLDSSAAAPLKGTDESGILEFGIVAGVKGMDSVEVRYGDNSATIYINIISLAIHNYAPLPEIEGGIRWSELMEAQLDYADNQLLASFPASLVQQNGEEVSMVGYMTPLDTDIKQKHFLLTSNPPSCFFHFPGGPAGVIEVFSEDGIESSWAAVKLTGKLVLVEASITGIIYQLENATLIE